MGFLRQQSGSTVTVDRKMEDVYAALLMAGTSIGKVKEQSKMAGYIVIKTPMKLFPPQNASTVRITVKKTGENQTEISFSSDSFDGTVGFGSAGKAIDSIIKDIEKNL